MARSMGNIRGLQMPGSMMDTTWTDKLNISATRMRSIGLVAGTVCAGAALFGFVHIYFLVEFFATFINIGLISLGIILGLFTYRHLPDSYEKWARVTTAILVAAAVTLSLMYLTRSWHMVHDLRL